MTVRTLPALILAGGQSRRMGRLKALEPLGTVRLVDRVASVLAAQCDPVLLNANDPTLSVAGLAVVPDRVAGFAGPLAGLAAGLAAIAETRPVASHVLVAPVDCPFLPADLSARLQGVDRSDDTIVLAASQGRVHPVCGLWPVSFAGPLARWLEAGASRRMTDFLAGREVAEVAFADATIGGETIDPFFNVNTPEDLLRARAILEAAP